MYIRDTNVQGTIIIIYLLREKTLMNLVVLWYNLVKCWAECLISLRISLYEAIMIVYLYQTLL